MKRKFIGVTIKGSHAKMSVDLTHGLVSFMVEGDEGSQSIFVYDAREIAALYRVLGQWLEEQEAELSRLLNEQDACPSCDLRIVTTNDHLSVCKTPDWLPAEASRPAVKKYLPEFFERLKEELSEGGE